jgi:hypothetical protein
VEQVCTCGARLPEDARFCHKCGRPLQEGYVAAEEAPLPAPTPETVAPAPQPAPPIGFRNRLAVRIALIAAGAICVLISVPLPGPISTIWQIVLLLAGGFGSVYLYARRSGEPVSVGSGARMGWLTGIFCFVFITLLFTFVVLIFSTDAGRESMSQALKLNPGSEDVVRQFEEMIRTPAGVFGPLLGFFVLLTSLPTIGGALGAKVLERE